MPIATLKTPRTSLALAAMLGAACLGLPATAGGFIDELSLMPSGAMTFVDGIEMGVDHYGENWALSRQVLGVLKPYSDTAIVDTGHWSLAGNFAGFDFAETITALGENKIRYQVKVKSERGIQTSQLAFTITLPVAQFGGQSLRCNGQPVQLPKAYSQESLYRIGDRVDSLEIPTMAGRLIVRGAAGLFVQDTRKFGDFYQWYTLRLAFSPDSGVLRRSGIDLTIELRPYRTEPLSIAQQANMGFADEVGGDGKGGWTDQGASNDLRMLPTGRKRLGGVLFDILDPAANHDRSCMVFAGPHRSAFLHSATVPAGGKAYPFLYLLHAIAWPAEQFGDVGRVRIVYADGDTETITVKFDHDVGNWWNAMTTANGDLAWTSRNGASYVGLYLSRFPVKCKPMASLTFEPTMFAVWMVAGVSLGDAVPKPFVAPPTYIVAGDQWTPYVYDLSVKAGSIMDFSSLHDAPAGKYGRVTEKNGHFAFANAPEKRTRFIGANLCFSANYLPKADCRILAENMARMGYNAVRFHHIDNTLSNFSDAKVELNAVELDKLDYLFAACKEQGLYITIDLHSTRITADGVVPGNQVSGNREHVLKALIPISEPARKNWEAYTRNLLTHVNPYTGLAWKDDPALFGIAILNENNLEFWVNEWPSIRELYQQAFARWLKENGREGAAQDAAERERLYMQFLAETQLRSYERCRDYIRSLGCQTLLTDVNFIVSPLTRVVRPHLDFVDNHYYRASLTPIQRWGNLPAKINNHENDLKTFASLPLILANARVFGKPHTVSEFNQAFPNRYRAESGLVMGTYAGLQDWDGLFRFAYSHTQECTKVAQPSVWMELYLDPVNLLSERISALLFLRGDVKPARQAVPLALSRQDALSSQIDDREQKEAYWKLGLRYRIGQWDIDTPNATPARVLTAVGVADHAPVKGVPYQRLARANQEALLKAGQSRPDWIDSDTGQIALSPATGQLVVRTEKTECFALEEKQTLTGNRVTVQNHGPFSIVAVSAMDGQPLANSRRLVVFHLTDSSNSAARYSDKECTILEDWGTLPHLVRRGSVTVTMKLDPKRQATIWAVAMNGERKNEIPARRRGDRVEFTVDTKQPSGGCMSYEIQIQ